MDAKGVPLASIRLADAPSARRGTAGRSQWEEADASLPLSLLAAFDQEEQFVDAAPTDMRRLTSNMPGIGLLAANRPCACRIIVLASWVRRIRPSRAAHSRTDSSSA